MDNCGLWSFAAGTFVGGKFFRVTPAGALDEREQVHLVSTMGPEPVQLDALITEWANEGNGQYLYGTAGGLVLQLQCFQLVKDIWRTLPLWLLCLLSNDDVHIHLARCRIVRLVLHVGQGHENGYYVQSLPWTMFSGW